MYPSGRRQHVDISRGAVTHAWENMLQVLPRRVRPLIPWGRSRNISARGADNPFLALHREMNRLFDDAFRDFGLTPFGSHGMLDRAAGNWPNVELSESDKDIKVTAELPGLDEKDVHVELANGMLAISGEKKTETEDKDRLYSERYYGRFERRLPVDDVDQDKVSASFKNGVLTVTMPKLPQAQSKVKRIAINGK
jgi:HSP20 family protein